MVCGGFGVRVIFKAKDPAGDPLTSLEHFGTDFRRKKSTKSGRYVKVRNALSLDNVRCDSLAEHQFTRAQYQVPTQNTSRQKSVSNLTPTMIARLYNSSHQFNRPIGAKETFINEDKI